MPTKIASSHLGVFARFPTYKDLVDYLELICFPEPLTLSPVFSFLIDTVLRYLRCFLMREKYF